MDHMKLTTPQVMGLFQVQQEAGFGHQLEFELLSQDDFGAIIVQVSSDLDSKKWKLPPRGGHELLS